MDYLEFLRRLHETLDPDHYLEIGVRWGNSLAQARCLSVGVDPDFRIREEIATDVRLFKTTSDEYFSRPDPLEPTGGSPFDLAFIDGMHLFEYALRDFINVERHSRPSGVIVFDDVLPRNVDEAARRRHTRAWTGDIYSILEVLRRYRPDVITVAVDTSPTGLLLVLGLDPDSTVLSDRYQEILAQFRRPDPQPVPVEVVERTFSQHPGRVLASPLLTLLAEAPTTATAADLAPALRAAAARSLGSAYAR